MTMATIPSDLGYPTQQINGEWYDDIVPRDRLMDPETEDLIYGDDLENGMVVIRERSGRLNEEHGEGGLLVTNRWARVSRVRAEANNEIYFIAEYADGQKCLLPGSALSGWVVKKDSIPVHSKDDEEETVYRYVCVNGCASLTTTSQDIAHCPQCDSMMMGN